MGKPRRGWLLVTLSTAGATASTRVYAWRKLRGLGALYLQQATCLLPDLPEVAKQVRRIADRVAREGGSARILSVTIADDAEERTLVEELRAARDAEYADLLDRLPTFFDELTSELARGNASYVEVEENEADLTRFTTWADRIRARDYFDASLAAQVHDELGRAADALTKFEAVALATEADEPAAGAGRDRPLRLVEKT